MGLEGLHGKVYIKGGEVKAVWELELELAAPVLALLTPRKSPRFVTRHASRLESDA